MCYMYQHDFKSVKERNCYTLCIHQQRPCLFGQIHYIHDTNCNCDSHCAFGIHRPMGKNTDLISTCQKTTMGLRKIIPGKDNLMEPDISIIEDLVKEPSSRTCLESYNLGRYFVCLINWTVSYVALKGIEEC